MRSTPVGKEKSTRLQLSMERTPDGQLTILAPGGALTHLGRTPPPALVVERVRK